MAVQRLPQVSAPCPPCGVCTCTHLCTRTDPSLLPDAENEVILSSEASFDGTFNGTFYETFEAAALPSTVGRSLANDDELAWIRADNRELELEIEQLQGRLGDTHGSLTYSP